MKKEKSLSEIERNHCYYKLGSSSTLMFLAIVFGVTNGFYKYLDIIEVKLIIMGLVNTFSYVGFFLGLVIFIYNINKLKGEKIK